MNDEISIERWAKLREATDTASKLTDKQFDQSLDYAKILRREIQAEGQFKKKLDGLAREFSLESKFGAHTGDKIIREQFELRYGESPNAHLQRLLEKEKYITVAEMHTAYEHANKVTGYMEQQANPNFYRAYDRVSNNLAHSLEITDRKARSLIVQTYKERHEQDYFRDFGMVEEKRIRKHRGLPDNTPELKQKAGMSA